MVEGGGNGSEHEDGSVPLGSVCSVGDVGDANYGIETSLSKVVDICDMSPSRMMLPGGGFQSCWWSVRREEDWYGAAVAVSLVRRGIGSNYTGRAASAGSIYPISQDLNNHNIWRCSVQDHYRGRLSNPHVMLTSPSRRLSDPPRLRTRGTLMAYFSARIP